MAAAGAVWWFWWVPSWRPALREGERYGVDVSSIDWAAVADDGIELAYVKATEGGHFVADCWVTSAWPRQVLECCAYTSAA